jgi:hypothetical protein
MQNSLPDVEENQLQLFGHVKGMDRTWYREGLKDTDIYDEEENVELYTAKAACGSRKVAGSTSDVVNEFF